MALAAAIAEANREKAVTLPALGAERTSSSKPEKRLGDLVHSESMPRMLGEMKGLTRTPHALAVAVLGDDDHQIGIERAPRRTVVAVVRHDGA